MSARFEVVRTDAGWHARFRAKNGRIVWVTESYTRRRAAVAAIACIGDAPRYSNGRDADLIEVRDVDERAELMAGDRSDLGATRDVDEVGT